MSEKKDKKSFIAVKQEEISKEEAENLESLAMVPLDEAQITIKELKELVESAYGVVYDYFIPQSSYQLKWKQTWIEKANKYRKNV